jgi:putative sigma-54 modulation protein
MLPRSTNWIPAFKRGLLSANSRRILSLDFQWATLQTLAMKLILSTHNIKLTNAIENHLLSRIDKLEHLDRWLVDARVTLEHDHTRTTEKAFKCSIRLGVRGADLYATDSENDLYAAIDLVTKKIQQQIRKRHNKHKDVKHSQASKTKRSRQEKQA